MWKTRGSAAFSALLCLVLACDPADTDPVHTDADADTDSDTDSDTDTDTDTDTDADLAFTSGPTLSPNTHGAKLVWWLNAETSADTTLEVTLDDGTTATTHTMEPAARVHEHMLLGLHADTQYSVTVRASTAEAEISAPALDLTTQPLPSALATALDVRVSTPAQMEPGFTLLSGAGHIFAIDAAGEIVWYYDGGAPWYYELNRTPTAPLLIQGPRTAIQELDMAGRVLRTFCPTALCQGAAEEIPVAVDVFHHDVIQLPNGNYVSIGIERVLVNDFPTSEINPFAPRAPTWVAADVFVEFDSTGTIVNQHHLLDILDPTRIGWGTLESPFWDAWFGETTADWAHANSLYYDALTDELVIGMRHQDAVIGMARGDGSLRWIVAPKRNWSQQEHLDLRLLPPDEATMVWAYHMHGSELTPEGNLLVFDNGNQRASAYEPPWLPRNRHSRAVEFAIDTTARTVETVWEFGSDMDPRHNSLQMGDANVLPETGNALIAFTYGADLDLPQVRLVEVTRTTPPVVVFDAYLPRHMYLTYRAQRLPSLYP